MHDEIAQLDGWAGSQKVDNFQENQRGIDALPAKAKWKFFSIPCLSAGAHSGVTKLGEFLGAEDKKFIFCDLVWTNKFNNQII